MRTIVVGIDGSQHAAAALRWAVREAELRQDRVIAVFAWGYIAPGHAGDGHAFDPEYGPAAAAEVLSTAVADAVGPVTARGIEQRVPYEPARQALLAAAEDADLLVVGARGVGGFRGLLMGSVSQACLHHTARPLAIIRSPGHAATAIDREPAITPGGRIVVGIDGSSTARRALQWALREARLRQATLDVVHAWQPPYAAMSPFADLPIDPSVLEKDARTVLDDAVDGEDTRQQPAPVERILAYGGAAPAILDASRDSDLVVLGSRGLSGFKGLLLGSVTHQVAHHVRCPLVIVP
jgi:nucleotide-binding universal stress UspA family protein